jgi:hypothetical protein
MADEGGDRELPQRLRDEARAATSPSATSPSGSFVAPVPSAELRRRLEAAVTAERSEAAAGEQDRPTGGEVTTPSVRSGNSLAGTRPPGPRVGGQAGAAGGQAGSAGGQGGSAGGRGEPTRAANAGPVTEDEVTEWLGTAGRSPAAATPPGAAPAAGTAAGTEAESEAESASWLGAGLAALIVIPALVIGSLAVLAVRHFSGTHASSPPSAAPARQEAAVRDEAIAWIVRQLRPGATVSCEQAMCAALEARGLPARDLLVLGPLSPDPRHTDVVVETATVRSLFGTSLDLAWSPAVLASFGSGPAGITVRVVAAHGAVAYQTALIGDLAAGKAAAARLLAVRRISVAATARAQLAAGLVDLRLLSALTALSRQLPVSLVDFGNVGAGANEGVPLRFADLSQASPAAGLTRAGYIRSVRSALSGLDTRFRPVRTVPVVLPDGQAVLRVEFTAPSPFQLSGS